MIIDATNLLVGRLASFVAKKALEGEKIDIVNAEKAVISGKKYDILARYKQRVERGDPLKGPYTPKTSDRMLRRMIRGMLPYKQERGKNAFKKVMCYIGVPEEFKNSKIETVNVASASKLKKVKSITFQEISQYLGK